MSRIHWSGLAALIVAAFVGYTVLIVRLSSEDAFDRAYAEQTADEYARYTSEYIRDACIGRAAPYQLDCAIQAVEAQREYERAENDVAAQRTMARWTAVVGYSAAVGLPLSAVGVWLIFVTWRETRRIGEAQVRAYISLSGVTIEPFSQPPGLTLNFANIGQSPARWVEVESNARVLDQPKGGFVFERDVEIDLTGRKQRWYVSGDQKHFGFGCHPKIIGGAEDDDDAIGDLIKIAVDENKLLVLQGMLRWETVFGEVFETAFFFWQWPKAAKNKWPEGAESEGTPSPVSIQMIRPAMSRHLPTYQQVK